MNPLSGPLAVPMSPWHMWGSSQVFVAQPLIPSQAAQLVRVNYKRPETWAFLFFARIVGAIQQPGAYQVRVNLDVIVGVGRSNVQMSRPGDLVLDDGFCKFVWTPGGGADPGNFTMKYTSAVRSPLLDDGDATSYQVIDKVVAEDIQVMCQVASTATSPVHVEVGAFFAPVNHIRPEWFCQQFPGSEMGGT